MAKKKTKKKKPVKKEKPQEPPKVTPYPTAGAKVTEFERLIDESLAGGGPETKRGPGRPRKEIEQADQGVPIELVIGVVKLPFELWAIGQGVKKLALSDLEANQLSQPVKYLLDYYLPRLPEVAYAWINLSVTGFWIMRSRLLIIAELKRQKQAQTSSAKQTGQRAETDSVPNQGQGRPGLSVRFPSKIEPENL